ncbi:MAG: DUF350 domain-containing protein [Lacunisphaera sp.]
MALFAADVPPPPGWHAQSLIQAIGYMVLFALIGILLAIAGYRIFDKCTPGDLHRKFWNTRTSRRPSSAGR